MLLLFAFFRSSLLNILFSDWEIKNFPVSGANLRHPGYPLNQRLGTLFLDHWVLYVLQHSFPLGICCFYTGFGRVLNFCVIGPFACQLFLFCTFTRGTGDTRSVLFGSGELFSTLAITDLLPLCSHFTRIQLVSLVKSCAELKFTQSSFALGFSSSPVL